MTPCSNKNRFIDCNDVAIAFKLIIYPSHKVSYIMSEVLPPPKIYNLLY